MGITDRGNFYPALADCFPEGWRRALGSSWAGSFEAGTPENRDGIRVLEGRGDRGLLPIRPGQGGSDRGAKQDSRRRIWLAKPWPNVRPHWRTVSYRRAFVLTHLLFSAARRSD